jgi:hypothetical protein
MRENAISVDGNGMGVFHLKTPKGGYVMSVRNRNGDEAKFLAALVQLHLRHSEP